MTGCDPACVYAGAVQTATPVPVFTGWAEQAVMVEPPSVNATVPPSGTGLTVAVNVTGCPTVDGRGGGAALRLVPLHLP